VFGDGSVRILETSGHTKGHISAILKTNAQNIILSFDASHLSANYELGIPSGSVSDEHIANESLSRLRHLESKFDNVQILFGHDPDQWKCHKILEIGEQPYRSC
jgi:glyoxylase-like metal-dependent hydrolase (beta-lactamase superfamily II)